MGKSLYKNDPETLTWSCSSPSGWSLSRHCRAYVIILNAINTYRPLSSSYYNERFSFCVFCQYGMSNKSYTEWCVIWLKNPHKHPWIPTQAFTLIIIRRFSWLFTGSDNKTSNLISGSHNLKILDKMLWVWHLIVIESERLVFHNGFKKYCQ